MMVAAPFNDEQKRYLEGFVSGLQTSRAAAGLKPVGAQPSSVSAERPVAGPDQPHHAALARFEREGRKLSNEEKAKRDDNPLDAYARLKTEAETGKFPKGVDNFRWRYHGLFYVAPAQDAFMCRLRIPNGILTHWQFAHVADLARRYGGGYTHVTTRANLRIREIAATGGPALVEGLADAGLTPKGSGADNIRNVTGSATAGIDPAELLDTRPFAREWHHHILNTRTLYGMPRKFNVAFDGGGAIPTLEETNDIAFTAVQVAAGSDGKPEVWFRLALGGITGHRDFARPAGVFVKLAEATRVAGAIVRVFIDHGDRTDRKKARLKYVLDTWGFEKFIAAVEEKLGALLPRFADGQVKIPSGQNRLAHIGAHAQRQEGKIWVGIVLPAGKLTCDQMHGLARLSHEMGDAVLAAMKAPGDFPVGGMTFREALLSQYSLGLAPDMLFELASYMVGGSRRIKLKALANGLDPDGDASTFDVLKLLEEFGPLHPDPEAFLESLDPLQPRLYSISSSPAASPGELHLTVDAVRYDIANRRRLGVASTFIADRLCPSDTVQVYVQKAHGFALPADPATPIIMIGPGTGIAPFRSFLWHRFATKASGKAWLFFGHQHEATDYLYQDELARLQDAGVLSKLSTAWSRDGAEKVYVQDRLRQEATEVWRWLKQGAHVYVCGDAKRMAKDVETALADVITVEGHLSALAARDYISDLRASGRYQADVY